LFTWTGRVLQYNVTRNNLLQYADCVVGIGSQTTVGEPMAILKGTASIGLTRAKINLSDAKRKLRAV
jgi:hypothetical protein